MVSNAVVAQMQISEAKGESLLNLTAFTVQKLLTAMNDCNEWGIIYILDALALYTPADGTETEKYRKLKKIKNKLIKLMIFL